MRAFYMPPPYLVHAVVSRSRGGLAASTPRFTLFLVVAGSPNGYDCHAEDPHSGLAFERAERCHTTNVLGNAEGGCESRTQEDVPVQAPTRVHMPHSSRTQFAVTDHFDSGNPNFTLHTHLRHGLPLFADVAGLVICLVVPEDRPSSVLCATNDLSSLWLPHPFTHGCQPPRTLTMSRVTYLQHKRTCGLRLDIDTVVVTLARLCWLFAAPRTQAIATSLARYPDRDASRRLVSWYAGPLATPPARGRLPRCPTGRPRARRRRYHQCVVARLAGLQPSRPCRPSPPTLVLIIADVRQGSRTSLRQELWPDALISGRRWLQAISSRTTCPSLGPSRSSVQCKLAARAAQHQGSGRSDTGSCFRRVFFSLSRAAVACLSVIPPSPIFLSPNLHRGFSLFFLLFFQILCPRCLSDTFRHFHTFNFLPSVSVPDVSPPLRTIGEGDVVYTVGFLIRSDPLWLGHSLSSVILGLGVFPQAYLDTPGY